MSEERFLAELGDASKPISASRLSGLSGLSRDEVKLFQKAWAQVEPERRRKIAAKLADLAEDNFDLDFEAVFRICLSDSDEAVRIKAIEGLRGCEERSLIEPLVQLLKHDRVESVRATAASALGTFALLAELEKLRPADSGRVEAALLSAIRDPDETVEVRRRALEAASALSRPEVAELIRHAYASGQHQMRISALYAMGRNCDPIWLALLVKELGSSDPEIRFEAARACGEMGDRRAVSHLIPMLRNPDTEVQVAAVTALGQLGGDDAKQELERCLQHPDTRLREAAEAALEEIGFAEEPLSFSPEH